MDITSNNMIEFGDFDTSFDQYLPDDCVEFPSSWPILDVKEKNKLTFTIPIVDILSSENDIDTINNNIPNAKTLSASLPKQFAALKQNNVTAPVLNGDNTKTDLPNGLPVSDLQNVEKQNVKRSDNIVNGADSKDPEIGNLNQNKIESVAKPNGNSISKSQNNDNAISNNNLPLKTEQNLNLPDSNIQNNEGEYRTKSETPSANDPKTPETKPAAPPKSSWAGLFKSNTNNNQTVTNTSNTAQKSQTVKVQNNKSVISPSTTQRFNYENNKNEFQNSNGNTKVRLVKMEEDHLAMELAERIQSQELIFKPQAFMPRGLINISNWCYVNATLQALLVCPPFYQLLKNLPIFTTEQRMLTATPIMDSFIRLASEFRPLSSKRGYQSNKEIRQGAPFEPFYIYDMLSVIESKLAEKGSQEDAEEFQSCILNGLHEEMTQLLSLVNNDSANSPDAKSVDFEHELPYEIPLTDDVTNGVDDITMNEWEEVVPNKKNRTAVTRRADETKTPISSMFRGELCTSVFRTGQKVSVSYEPFFSLPLDVLNNQSWTVDDALLNLTEKERFSGNGSENSDVIRQQTLEVLPPVLILHLKRFVYDKKGGSKKIDRKVDYKTDLVISKEILSKNARKVSLSQRSYKLFAVVYHHGEKVCGGHYTTDVFHIGLSSWLRIDDQNIKPLHYQEALRHSPPKTAYILYYRRTDLG